MGAIVWRGKGLADAQSGDELGEGDEEEVEVEKELELFVEDEGEEGGDVVLLIADEVGRELALLVGAVKGDRAELGGGFTGRSDGYGDSLGLGLRLVRLQDAVSSSPSLAFAQSSAHLVTRQQPLDLLLFPR